MYKYLKRYIFISTAYFILVAISVLVANKCSSQHIAFKTANPNSDVLSMCGGFLGITVILVLLWIIYSVNRLIFYNIYKKTNNIIEAKKNARWVYWIPLILYLLLIISALIR